MQCPIWHLSKIDQVQNHPFQSEMIDFIMKWGHDYTIFNANKLINMFSMSIYVSDSLTLDSNHIMGFVHCLLIVVTMMCQCCSSPDFVWILHLHWYHQWWCTWLLVLMHCSIFCGCSFLSCFRWSFAISVIWCHHKASIIRKCIMHDLISLIHILC